MSNKKSTEPEFTCHRFFLLRGYFGCNDLDILNAKRLTFKDCKPYRSVLNHHHSCQGKTPPETFFPHQRRRFTPFSIVHRKCVHSQTVFDMNTNKCT